MELVLVCPHGFHSAVDKVVSALCSHPLLTTGLDELITSSDCLDFALAFQAQLKCPNLLVDYHWDDQHMQDRAEPAVISSARYVNHAWFPAETYDAFAQRLWNAYIGQTANRRVVLCGKGVLDIMSGNQAFSMCSFIVNPARTIPAQTVTFEEVNQLLQPQPQPLLVDTEDNNQKAQRMAAAITEAVAKSIGEVQVDSLPVQTTLINVLSEQITQAMTSLDQYYSEKVTSTLKNLQGKQAEYSSKLTSVNSLISQLETSQRATLDLLQSAQPAAAFNPKPGEPIDPRITDLKKKIEVLEKRFGNLYADLPVKKMKEPPLQLEIDEGVCEVVNRKLYPLQALELLYSPDNGQFVPLMEFTAPPGKSQHPMNVPQINAKQLTFVIRQHGREVCKPNMVLLEEQDAVPEGEQGKMQGSAGTGVPKVGYPWVKPGAASNLAPPAEQKAFQGFGSPLSSNQAPQKPGPFPNFGAPYQKPGFNSAAVPPKPGSVLAMQFPNGN